MYKLFLSHNQNPYLIGLLSVIADIKLTLKEIVWWMLSNITLIMGIRSVVSEIIANETYSYWWSYILVFCCHFCIFYICTNSPYLGLCSATWFVRISLLVVEIQVKWSLWQNRQTENINQELDKYLQLFVNERQSNWYNFLSIAEFKYNNHVYTSTQ